MPTGIRVRGKCTEAGCGKRFKWDPDRKGFVCPEHHIRASYYLIEFNYKGQTIVRGTDFNGQSLNTYAAALSLYNQAQTEIKGKRFDPSKWTARGRIEFAFKTKIQEWYREKERLLEKGRRAVTYVPKLKGYIKSYYLPFFSEMDVREIFPTHVNEWYLSLPQKSPKTIKNLCDALRNFFNWLHQGRIIEYPMPFPAVEVPEHEPECLSPEMQMAILEKIPEIHRPIYAFLFYQGCRIGEVRALKWDCINGDVVTYKRAFSANKLAEFTKTKKIRHNLVFPETLAILPERGFPLDFVFTHTYGGHKRPYQENMLNRIYRVAIDKINAEKGLSLTSELYEHSKHSWGTQYINSGLDRGVIKDWFGHTDMKTTEKYAKFKVVDAVRKVVQLKASQQ